MGVHRRNIIKPEIRKALRPRTTARALLQRRAPMIRLDERPVVAWKVETVAPTTAHRAVQVARECFRGRDVDAVLGWLFSRLPVDGATGDDMVQHHLRLRDDRYYEAWVTFCARLGLKL
jgi:5-methylcytosine-specific restriction endonuclease McrA